MSIINVEYIGDLRTRSTHIDSGDVISTDAPIDNNGLGRKFSPTDLVASSLGSCLLTIMGIVAKRHNIDMVGTYANVEKTMGEQPRRISQIAVDIYFKSELNEANRKILHNASKHCPVHNSLSGDIDIQVNFRDSHA